MRRLLMAAVVGGMLATGPAWARHPNIADNTIMMSSIADASVSTKACGYRLNSDRIMGDMLAEYDTFDAFAAQGYGDQLDHAETELKNDRTGFCRAAYKQYGPAGTRYKDLLRPAQQ